MTQLLSLNTQFIAHSSADFTVYSQNFTKGANLLTGELKKILKPKLFTTKRNSLRTRENYVRNLCRIPNAMLSPIFFRAAITMGHKYLLLPTVEL